MGLAESSHILRHDMTNLSKVQKVLVAASCPFLSLAAELFLEKITDVLAKFVWVPWRYPGLSMVPEKSLTRQVWSSSAARGRSRL